MAKKLKTIIVGGPPGSGKSTVVSRIHSDRVKKISTGDILRDEIKSGSSAGKRLKSYMDRGELAPSDLVRTLISRSIDEKIDGKINMFVFDGYPRDLEEVGQFLEMADRKGLSLDAVIILSLSEEKIVSRVINRRVCPNCGAIYNIGKNPPSFEDARLQKRKDDDEETLKKQLKEFRENTLPAIKYFREEYGDIILEQDAGLPVNRIMYDIFTGLDRRGIMLFDGGKDER